MRVAYTLEQCWHRVPGGTGVAAIEVARELAARPDLTIVGVAGRHRRPATEGFVPPIPVSAMPLGGPLLYETWLRFRWPKVESVADVDIVHSTTIIPPATDLPLVATIHDVAFLRHPEFFTERGTKVFRRSLDILRERADAVLCSSVATMEDCVAAGFHESRLVHVPLGVRALEVGDPVRHEINEAYQLPARFVLFVGTLEPRKNLPRLLDALALVPDAPPLVVAGMRGWGEDVPRTDHDVRFIGHVPAHHLPALYEACTVFAFPSVLEGFGLPVAEAMAQGAIVVTSRGTSTEEVAGGAAHLVDPLDVESIAAGISDALAGDDAMRGAARDRARRMSWSCTADMTVDAYRTVLDPHRERGSA